MVPVGTEVGEDWIHESVGTVLRHSNDRASSVQIINNRYVLCTGAKSSEIEIFILSSPEEAVKKQKKRLKKNPSDESRFILRDLIRRVESVKASEGKIKSVDAFVDSRDQSLKVKY